MGNVDSVDHSKVEPGKNWMMVTMLGAWGDLTYMTENFGNKYCTFCQ